MPGGRERRSPQARLAQGQSTAGAASPEAGQESSRAGILTALDGVGGRLQGHDPAAGLGDVHAEHQAHPRVLAADVGLALAQLDVRVAQLQDPRAVDAATHRARSLLCPAPLPPRGSQRLQGPALLGIQTFPDTRGVRKPQSAAHEGRCWTSPRIKTPHLVSL